MKSLDKELADSSCAWETSSESGHQSISHKIIQNLCDQSLVTSTCTVIHKTIEFEWLKGEAVCKQPDRVAGRFVQFSRTQEKQKAASCTVAHHFKKVGICKNDNEVVNKDNQRSQLLASCTSLKKNEALAKIIQDIRQKLMLIIYCPYLIRSTIPTPCYTAIQIGQADCRPADNNYHCIFFLYHFHTFLYTP